MAISFDTAGQVTSASLSGTSFSQSITVSSGDSVLIVGVHLNSQTSATYNGVASTTARTENGLVVYTFQNPAVGTANFIVNSTAGNGTSLTLSWALYKGASSSPDSTVANFSGATATSLVTTIDNSWTVLIGCSDGGNGAWIAGTGSTVRQNTGAQNPSTVAIFDSNAAITPAGSYSMTTTPPAGTASVVMCSLAFQAVARAQSDSVMNGASRTASAGRTIALTKALSDSIGRAASRTMTVVRDWPRTVSLTMMNSASRLITLFSKGGIWTTVVKHTSTFTNQVKD